MLESFELARGFIHLHVRHARGGWAAPHPVEHLRHIVPRAVNHGLDGAIAAVAHPTRHAEALGFAPQIFPESYALHAAADDRVPGNLHSALYFTRMPG